MKKLLVLICIILQYCISFASEQERYYSHLDYVREHGEIRVGMAPEYVPFEFKNKNGELIGFDVDIATKLAQALHVKLKIIEYKWENLDHALRNGEIDIIISGMTRTLDRAFDTNFSDPYFQTGQVAIVNIRDKKIRDYRELNKKEIKIAVVKETTGEDVAMEKLSNVTFVAFRSEEKASSALIKGKVDALVYDKPFADFLVTQNPKLRILTEQLNYEYYSFAIDKGDPDFLRWLDYFIAELKLAGEYDEIYNKWLKK